MKLKNKLIKKQKFEIYEWVIQLQELECWTCKVVKKIECFTRRKDTELGVRNACKSCMKQHDEYYFKKSESLKKKSWIRNK